MRAPSSAETSASVRPTSGISPACSWAAMTSTDAPAAARASTSAASFTIRNGPTTSTARRNAAPGSCGSNSTRKRAHIWSPIATLRARTDEPGDDRRRILGLLPRTQVEDTRLRLDARRLEPRDDHRRVAVAWHHEHRQSFEWHRVVAGQVRQVMADRQEQHVDAEVGHRRTDSRQPVEVDRAHGASQSAAHDPRFAVSLRGNRGGHRVRSFGFDSAIAEHSVSPPSPSMHPSTRLPYMSYHDSG